MQKRIVYFKQKYMLMLRTTFLALCLVACNPAFAWHSPKEAIEHFLSFELNGGRLSSTNWKAYTEKYIAAPPDYDEPGWDQVAVVTSWKTSNPRCTSQNRCTVEVRFTLLPTAELNDPSVIAHPAGGTETLTYKIVRHRKDWRIEPEMPAPRILDTHYRKLRQQS